MIILHAAFCEASLLLWGESSDEAKVVSRKRRSATPVAHFDLGAAGLRTLALELGIVSAAKSKGKAKSHASGAQEAVAWLPSTEQQPVPSMTDDPPAEDSCCVAPCIINALQLDAQQSLNLLAACGTRRLLRPGLLIGSDLSYWSAALRFAAGLVMRGQFLPGLEVANGDGRALWQPVFSGPDAGRLHALAKAMPPAARAVSHDTQEPAIPAQTALRGFLEA